MKLIVTADKLNKRSFIPSSLPEPKGIVGTVIKGFSFEGTEVPDNKLPNASLGKWYVDRDNSYYWAKALQVVAEVVVPAPVVVNTNPPAYNSAITAAIKLKIEHTINAFETGSLLGDYSEIVKYDDYTNPQTKQKEVQVTYGRSQTTEYGHLSELVENYVSEGGKFADTLKPYVGRVGKHPSLASDKVFCDTLIAAGKQDPIMKSCQDELFEERYYQPALNWFAINGFTLPLSMLVIYDSHIHSGSILKFLRNKFDTLLPIAGGNEKEWITNYVNARNSWLENNNSQLLRNTVYRTACFKKQIATDNWNLDKAYVANDVKIG